MNLFQLVFKQMRQRSLSTWLTMLSVLLGVALAIAIMILRRESESLFGIKSFGYELLVGPKGSPLQLVVNTIYHIDVSPGVIKYDIYEQLDRSPLYRPYVKSTIPVLVGDYFKGHRIIATLPKYLGFDDEGKRLEDAKRIDIVAGRAFEFAQGKVFHPKKFQAVLGAEVAAKTGTKLGDKIKAAHDAPRDNPADEDEHDQLWEVVGILAPTHSAEDRCVFVPLVTSYTIEEHEKALEDHAVIRAGQDPSRVNAPAHHDHHDESHEDIYHLNDDGTIDLKVPKEKWELSAVLVHTRGFPQALQLQSMLRNGVDATVVSPAEEMRKFFQNFLSNTSLLLLIIAILVTVVATVGILVSIYNSVSARLREIAILRALGATRKRVLAIICLEAAMVGFLGAVLGLVAGHALAAIGSVYMQKLLGQGIAWLTVDPLELIYLACVVAVAAIAGLVPAMKAYRTSVAANLVGG